MYLFLITIVFFDYFSHNFINITSCYQQLNIQKKKFQLVIKFSKLSIRIPELDWDIGMGCLSGKFTTIEGILKDLRTDLIEKNPFASGDSAVHEGR